MPFPAGSAFAIAALPVDRLGLAHPVASSTSRTLDNLAHRKIKARADARYVVGRSHVAIGVGRERLRIVAIGDQRAEYLRQAHNVATRHQSFHRCHRAGSPWALAVGRDDRQAMRHGFDQHDAERFVVRGQAEHIDAGEERRLVVTQPGKLSTSPKRRSTARRSSAPRSGPSPARMARNAVPFACSLASP